MLRVFVSYSQRDDQVLALRLQTLASTRPGLHVYVPAEHLNLFREMAFLFDEIHIPRRVREEFKKRPQSRKVLARLRTELDQRAVTAGRRLYQE